MNIVEKFKNRSYFLVIRVKAEGLKIPIVIPIPLGLVEDFLISTCRVGQYSVKLLPKLEKKFNFKLDEHFDLNSLGFDIGSASFLDSLIELLHELQHVGPFTLVEVKEKDAHISIKIC